MPGLNVMLAQDYYPEGHQGGVSVIQNGKRVATNGDIRISPTPGQWDPTPAAEERKADLKTQEISVRMHFPNEKKNRTGYNPVDYPDLRLDYTVRIKPEGNAFRIIVDFDKPIPADWQGRVCFSMELFPGLLFGKSYEIGKDEGVFARQPNGPAAESAKGSFMKPLGTGPSLTVAAETDSQRMTIHSARGGNLTLIDGRERSNDGWYIVREFVPANATKNAIEWLVTPNVLPDWKSTPVIQFSQIGYHPNEAKVAIVELDKNDHDIAPVALYKLDGNGMTKVMEAPASDWGRFLRYHYLQFDFSSVKAEGMYILGYKGVKTPAFAISPKVYERGVWQPTLEYFLPVQMCHMRVVENFRVWHGLCHEDDAVMAPVNHGHFDGYAQGPSTYCKFKSGEHVPGLDAGGWHDAGDLDLRVESQTETAYFLALAYEKFHPDFDNTTIDEKNKLVLMHEPDGKPDILQQIEHGLISVVGGYKSLGRLYRGIQDASLNQYVHLGDAATASDGIVFNDDAKGTAFNALTEASATGNLMDTDAIKTPSYGMKDAADDRWVFTENNPRRELEVACELAASARVMKGYNDALADDCRTIAIDLWNKAEVGPNAIERLGAAIELYITTGDKKYADAIPPMADAIAAQPEYVAWLGAYSLKVVNDPAYKAKIRAVLKNYRKTVDEQGKMTPYGIPYVPDVWGAGWTIQHIGIQQYFLHEGAPDIFTADAMFKALEFVLGRHPGENNASFVSGVGPNSVLTGYGINRADWSYIPGGIASGTALIRPDYPELNNWPFFWQQNEYCLGGPTSEYVFLVLAADHLLNGEK
jgi:endoglucanase